MTEYENPDCKQPLIFNNPLHSLGSNQGTVLKSLNRSEQKTLWKAYKFRLIPLLRNVCLVLLIFEQL